LIPPHFEKANYYYSFSGILWMTMKKTACLKICKKQAPPNGGPVEPQEERPFVASPPEEHPPPGMTMPSPEEAALTSKNYRLAKALVRSNILCRDDDFF
jgi:hypothetical protein